MYATHQMKLRAGTIPIKENQPNFREDEKVQPTEPSHAAKVTAATGPAMP